MNMISPAGTKSTAPSLKVKGRLIPQKDFIPRFQNMCSSIGMKNLDISSACGFDTSYTGQESGYSGNEENAVIMLSCRVRYNPGWGGLCGLPQLRSKVNGDQDECPSEFLDPFLRLYKLAQQQITLLCPADETYLISIPSIFLGSETKQGCSLNILLDKVASKNAEGNIVPVSSCGSRVIYEISKNFLETLHTMSFTWHQRRTIRIEEFLTEDLFRFRCSEDAVDRNSPFFPTLFPYMRQLVSHKTPHLRAAEIHLQHEYNKAVFDLTTKQQESHQNLACVAGVVIDMTSFAGHEETYFVPWKAYLEHSDHDNLQRCSLEQDDLFVRLMH